MSFQRLAAYFARGDPSDWRFSPAGLISHEPLHPFLRQETKHVQPKLLGNLDRYSAISVLSEAKFCGEDPKPTD